jgi:3-oxoacyl-[acyl-carrier protein] reductase
LIDRSIINTSSVSFLFGSPWRPNYGAAKGAIAVVTVGTAASCAWFGVRANAICPTAVGRMSRYSPNADTTPHPGTPEGNSPFVVYLASEAAKDVTGQLFRVEDHDIRVIGPAKIEALLHSEEVWTPDEVARQLGEYFSVPREAYGWPVSDEIKARFPTLSG